jgi:ABC-type bacteriocin/lantibiotic exporter with double-glycine peptidase domain
VAQAMSWRRSSGERRQQLKWLLAGAGTLAVGQAVFQPFQSNPNLSAAAQGILNTVSTVTLAALPVGLAVAIMRYRLYEIDRIISRTLAYAIVTGVLVGVYAGLVLLATQVLSVKSPVAVAAATLATAALFNPLRRRVQRIVDRRFNRTRYDADQMVTAFAGRLKDAVDLDAVQADLAAVVQRALEPAHLSLWTNNQPGA